MRRAVLALAAALYGLLPGAAPAGEMVIALPGAANPETIKASYACAGFGTVEATYLNAPPVALATLSFKGEFQVLSNVLSGSGARYAGGPYVWWTKGRAADLYDLRQGESAAPIASCMEKGS